MGDTTGKGPLGGFHQMGQLRLGALPTDWPLDANEGAERLGYALTLSRSPSPASMLSCV